MTDEHICTCHANDYKDVLLPQTAVVTDIRTDTPDVKTFRVVTPEGKIPFDHMPGQCAMLTIPGVGEAMFSITSSPTNEEYMEFITREINCGGCPNNCEIICVYREGQMIDSWGNRCQRGEAAARKAAERFKEE